MGIRIGIRMGIGMGISLLTRGETHRFIEGYREDAVGDFAYAKYGDRRDLLAFLSEKDL